jgi:hypothetical protein
MEHLKKKCSMLSKPHGSSCDLNHRTATLTHYRPNSTTRTQSCLPIPNSSQRLSVSPARFVTVTVARASAAATTRAVTVAVMTAVLVDGLTRVVLRTFTDVLVSVIRAMVKLWVVTTACIRIWVIVVVEVVVVRGCVIVRVTVNVVLLAGWE